MASEVGELFVGAYLRKVLGCPIVQYNLRDNGGVVAGLGGKAPKSKSQAEIDVLGLDYTRRRLFVCEVVTHLGGALYSAPGTNTDETVARLERKLVGHRDMIRRDFPDFSSPTFMVWSPYVAAGAKVEGMLQLSSAWPKDSGSLELKINEAYTAAVQQLFEAAAVDEGHTEEPFFRTCQLLTHLRNAKNRRVRVRFE